MRGFTPWGGGRDNKYVGYICDPNIFLMYQANWTFQAVADSIKAGHWWLKYSKKVQTTINSQNFTSRLQSMKQLYNLWNENEVKKNLEKYGLLDFNPFLVQGFDVNKITERLKFADYVVKVWLSKVENISLDVYLGFNTTQDLDNFMVNKSGIPKYKDRKVIAGEWYYLC